MKTITFYTKPVPVNQKYFVRNGRNILSNKYRQAKGDLALETRSQWNSEPLGRNVELNIIQYFGDKRKRDIDAYLKILLDSMEGIVYLNDNQINAMHVFKEYDKENPRIDIQILWEEWCTVPRKDTGMKIINPMIYTTVQR